MRSDDESVTYHDGVGVVRCATCLHPLNTPTGEPLVSVRVRDVAAAVRLLSPGPEAEAVALRFAQALGQALPRLRATLAARVKEATDAVDDADAAAEGEDL